MANKSLSSNDITILRKQMFKDRFQSELEYTKDKTREEQLNKIIGVTNKPVKESKLSKHMQTLDEITKLSYMKPWGKLQSFQKDKLLKEYCVKQFEGNSKEAHKFVINNYEKKRLHNKNIDYDPKQMKILSISGFVYENGTFKIKKQD
jgi:hypothetical protein